MGDKSPKQQRKNAQQRKKEKRAQEEARRARTPQSPPLAEAGEAARK